MRPVPHSQRASRIEDSGELGVGKRDRRHAAGPRAVGLRHTRFGVLEQNSGAESQACPAVVADYSSADESFPAVVCNPPESPVPPRVD